MNDNVHADNPIVRLGFEWRMYPLWLRYVGYSKNIAGDELGLSPGLVADILSWGERGDDAFDSKYPPDTEYPEDFFEQGFELAKRVRAELGPEWTVESMDPQTFRFVVLPSAS